jgi:hypothetical protein
MSSYGGAITSKDDLLHASQRNNICLNAIVYKDALKQVPIRNGGYIINMANETDNNGGTHWVGFWIEGKRAVYFDPFGIIPPEEVEHYLSKHNTMYVTKQIQNVFSDICGYYVLYFMYWMNKQRKIPIFKRADVFCDLFSSDPKDNRKILENLLKPLQ